MNRTSIEWVKNPDGAPGFTWNPITGCLNHDNGLCKGGGFPCYAYRLAHGRLRERYLANKNLAKGAKGGVAKLTVGSQVAIKREGDYADPFYPRFWPERLEEFSELAYKPKGIFTCDMGELFGAWVPEEWTRQVLSTIKHQFLHRFYLLTKQPQNLLKWSPFPPNCFVGVTVCTNGMMTNALYALCQIEAKVKYISFEPLLGSIGMSDHMSIKGVVDWVIIGAQTKPAVYPRKEWIDEIVDAADRVGVAVFLKDNLRPALKNVYGDSLPMRQEMPVVNLDGSEVKG